MEPILCKLRFKLEQRALGDGTTWPDADVETTWGEMVDDDHAVILNTPAYALNVSFLDEVLIRKILPKPEELYENMYDAGAVTKRSGHSTIRVILRRDDLVVTADNAVAEIKRFGCTLESGPRIVAIDVPPEGDLDAIFAVLNKAQQEGAVFIDVGYLAKPAGERSKIMNDDVSVSIVRELAEKIPALRDTLAESVADNHEILPYIVLPDFVRQLSTRGSDADWKTMAQMVNAWARIGQPAVMDLLILGIMEDVFALPAWPQLRDLFSPLVREKLRQLVADEYQSEV